ncbi:hypothetical protein LRP31_09475 [Mesorhizobium mediterraneum]|uniref:hypothetical protein n=2 Tax=Phyllobacteriaceae TaxID=69277 RepID=UPI0013052C10|nr:MULTISPECIES: hypothetical protein [Mesorhizobium]MCF6101626.1 hypothetical protein [Mesorhizobium muleiense]WIW55426.1 hypothetical protein LRP31_09475 [Mesorhizobium mediterraneum]
MNLPLSRCPGTINRPLSLVIGGVAPEARAGEFEERVAISSVQPDSAARSANSWKADSKASWH